MTKLIPGPYFLLARLLPAVIGALPFFVFYYYFLHPWLGGLSETFLHAQWPGDVTGSAALIYLLVLAGRSISKDIFERAWFRKDETRMPTTNFLLHGSGAYSPSFRMKIHERIATDFGIAVLSADLEANDENAARQVIAEAISLIRQRVKDGRLLLQHNIEYGFFRNLLGCSVLALLMSLANVALFLWVKPDHVALVTSATVAIFYLTPILLSKILMNVHGNRYARVLFQEYLAS